MGIVGKVLAFLSPIPIIGITLHAASYDSSLVDRRSEEALAKAGHSTDLQPLLFSSKKERSWV